MAFAQIPSKTSADPWDDSENGFSGPGGSDGQAGRPFRPLTREEASALRLKQPPLSPWRVVVVQLAVGLALALATVLVTGQSQLALSVLYGALTVVLPGALMARGMTSRLSSLSPGAGAVSFLLWEMVKIAASIALLALAPKVVQPLSWPALLVGLVVCMKVYLLALLWRPAGR